MRRRQATNSTDNDISTGENKYSRRQRNRFSSSIPFVLLIIIPLYLVINKQASTSSIALNSIGDVKNSSNSTTPDKRSSSSTIPDSAAKDVHINNRSAPPKRRTYEPPAIPRRLIFTYKYNLIAPAKNDPPFNYKDPLTANVLHTIEKYQHYWDAKDAKARSRSKQQAKEEVVVSFLSDNSCLEVIKKAEPRLVQHFQRERMGEYKADICRVAELYLYGGYYFDIDISVIEPLNFDALDIPSATPDVLAQLRTMNMKNLRTTPSPDDIVTLSTVYSTHQGGFFQGFTAATPRHPVLKRSLGYMDAYYEGTLTQTLPQHIIEESHNAVVPSRTKPQGMGVGPYTLSVAYRSTTHEEWEEYVRNMMKDHGYSSGNEEEKPYGEVPAKRRYARFLYEISLEDEEVKRLGLWADVPLQDAEYQRKVKWCNYVCFGGQQVYFYSRVPGS
eukprot:CAMPEP_0201879438 /NCGR_PEP_ID=MMETSP0902-20130614/10310_1 /ASSEMBLY_ACC=CAM_ASM_000551 /TAXON_ID=420261 /ORGANISM="Thalassiosira antarctica, Strain CCMP982" /LENGTH=443 /DNA_ID=CAMNT_0048407247 /DNA_START=17 /DNA_END=1344 /DNA_ORIENTATION=-